MGKNALFIVLIVISGLLAGAVFFSKYNSIDKNTIKISGRIEVDEIDIAFKTPGRIDNFSVEEGDILSEGAFIASISAKEIKAKVEGIKKDLESSKIIKNLKDNQLKIIRAKKEQLKDKKRMLDVEIENAVLLAAQSVKNAGSVLNIRLSDYEKIKFNHQKVKKDYERISNLIKENAVSQKSFDEIYALYNITTNELKSAEDAVAIARGDVATAQNNLKLAKSKNIEKDILNKEIDLMDIQLSSGENDKIVAENNVAKLQNALEEAQVYLDDTRIFAHNNLIVLKKYVQNGELVSAGLPIISAYEKKNKYFRGFLPEMELSRVKTGMKGKIMLDGYGDALDAEITYISDRSEFTPKEVQTQAERVKQVYLIKAKVTDPNEVTKPGMPADLSVNLSFK